MSQSLIPLLNLPDEILSKIYYLSLMSHPCKQSILETYADATEYKTELDKIYKNLDYFIFPDGYISAGLLVYLSHMLLNDDREHSHYIDPDTETRFILFH
jgi:hypothetical protein